MIKRIFWLPMLAIFVGGALFASSNAALADKGKIKEFQIVKVTDKATPLTLPACGGPCLLQGTLDLHSEVTLEDGVPADFKLHVKLKDGWLTDNSGTPIFRVGDGVKEKLQPGEP